MKTSDTLLIGSTLIGLLTLVGSTVALRNEHDKIDFTDPFYGYQTTAVNPYKVLRIEGSKSGILPLGTAPVGSIGISENPNDSYTTVGIQAGKAFEIRVQKSNKIPFTYRSIGDTLLIQYEPDFYSRRITADEAFSSPPFIYLIAPSFQKLIASRTTCKLAGLTTENVSIQAANARVLLSKSTVNQLTSTGQRGSIVQIAATNRIHSAMITSLDSTGFIAERNVFDSITLQNDSTAIIKIPASLLTKLK